jgi:serine/threonine protein kinase
VAKGDPREVAGVREGQVLAGKYQVERVLGVGGMGAVVAAHHLQLDTKVALKFLLPAMLEHPEAVGRFAREARAAVKITSEHVARVFDVGTLESGAPYLVMEFLEGGDLGSRLRQRGPLPIDEAVEFVLQACIAIAEAHSLGIVHRDLKPANLFCVRRTDGSHIVKVLDFGISKATQLSASGLGSSMTQTSTVMGSPLYMSPEQMQSTRDVDAQTDIWALGITLYELLAGVTPFTGESYAEIAIRVATAPFSPLRSHRPDAPAGLEAVVASCLEKDTRKRASDVAELAQALAPFGSIRARVAAERIVGILRAAGVAPITQSQIQISRSSRPSGAGARLPNATTVLPESSSLASLGTMAPSATTAARLRGTPAPRKESGASGRTLVPILIAACGITIAGGVGLMVGASGAQRAREPSAAAAIGASPVLSSPPPAAPAPAAPSALPSAPAAAGDLAKRPPIFVATTAATTRPALPAPMTEKPTAAIGTRAPQPQDPDDSDPLAKLKLK